MATNRNIKENLSVVVDGKPAKAATAAAITEVEPALDFSDLDSPELYLNRELTWLEFNRRVLHEAQDESNPLLERLKFVGIVSSNLDEFFMKRIGGLKQQVGAGVLDYSVDGRLPAQQIEECYVEVRELEAEKSELVPRLIAQLAEHDIHITPYEALGDEDQETIRSYYFDNIYPLVTPQGVDSAHPFPFISNLSLNLLVTLRHSDSEDELRARVKVPVGLGIPRFLQVPNTHIFVPLESVMAKNLDVLFPNMEIVASETFYVTRNANAARDEDEADDLLAIIESEVRHRRFAKIVRVVRCLRKERAAGDARPAQPGQSRNPGTTRSAAPPDRPSQARAHAQYFPRGARSWFDPAASPLRIVFDLGRTPAARGQSRPEGAGDQDDAVPHVGRYQGHRLPGRRGAKRQAGRGRGGTKGAFRRSRQYPLVEPAGRSRYPRNLWRDGAQNPLQGNPGGAQRLQRAAPLRAHRHRQLPCR
jgi:hypothetical protein